MVEATRVIPASGFHGGVAVHNGFAVLGYPSRQPFSDRVLLLPEESEIVAIHAIGRQMIAFAHIYHHYFVRSYLAERVRKIEKTDSRVEQCEIRVMSSASSRESP